VLPMPPLYIQRRVVPLSRGLSLLFASVCVSCVWSQQPNTHPTASPPSKPAPEMRRLAAALGGRWSVRQQFESTRPCRTATPEKEQRCGDLVPVLAL
jgi:hypothetical protein